MCLQALATSSCWMEHRTRWTVTGEPTRGCGRGRGDHSLENRWLPWNRSVMLTIALGRNHVTRTRGMSKTCISRDCWISMKGPWKWRRSQIGSTAMGGFWMEA